MSWIQIKRNLTQIQSASPSTKLDKLTQKHPFFWPLSKHRSVYRMCEIRWVTSWNFVEIRIDMQCTCTASLMIVSYQATAHDPSIDVSRTPKSPAKKWNFCLVHLTNSTLWYNHNQYLIRRNLQRSTRFIFDCDSVRSATKVIEMYFFANFFSLGNFFHTQKNIDRLVVLGQFCELHCQTSQNYVLTCNWRWLWVA